MFHFTQNAKALFAPTYAPPERKIVTQVNLTHVLVDWGGTVSAPHCAADFVVKLFPRGDARGLRLSGPFAADARRAEVEVGGGAEGAAHGAGT